MDLTVAQIGAKQTTLHCHDRRQNEDWDGRSDGKKLEELPAVMMNLAQEGGKTLHSPSDHRHHRPHHPHHLHHPHHSHHTHGSPPRPAGETTDDVLDVSRRAEVSTMDDYDNVPIEQYGLAMLRGMGWKPGILEEPCGHGVVMVW